MKTKDQGQRPPVLSFFMSRPRGRKPADDAYADKKGKGRGPKPPTSLQSEQFLV